MPSLKRASQFVLPLMLVASLLVILVPLPSVVMDVLLATNIAVSVLILLTTVFVQTPLEFSVFPTVLLVATLGRLVLNVATTRLILTAAGESGLGAAGGIIEGFGSFVAGNQVVVGFVIFLIIVLIQFLVVTKGATRMSEVAARFALDGMPGRQMAIDADVSAGIIDQAEAKQRRNELLRHADFYGAMDGASKFVRGDAIAGLVITFINIIGGLFVGVVQQGMSLGEAANVFTRLTIGDGLVSQVPAFLIALAAGLLITRSSERSNLPVEFLRQLLVRPEPLIVSAAFMGILVFTGLPVVPLLIVGGSLTGIALVLTRSPGVLDEDKTDLPQAKPMNPGRVEDLLRVDPVELELGVGLVRLADVQRGGDLLERIARLRQQVAVEYGMVLPRVRIRDNLGLDEHVYRFKVFGDVVVTDRVYPLRILASTTSSVDQTIDGIPCRDPMSGSAAFWIDPGLSQSARRHGYRMTAAVDVIVGHLKTAAVANASELLNRDAVQKLIDRVRNSSPAVVEELIPDKLGLGTVQHVLQGLLAESVSIRNLPLILETLCDVAEESTEPSYLVEQVRRRLGRTITAACQQADGSLHVMTLDSDWEVRLSDENALSALSGSEMLNALQNDIEIAIQGLVQAHRPPVILVRSDIRALLRRLTKTSLPQLIVLSYQEIPDETDVRSEGEVGANHLSLSSA